MNNLTYTICGYDVAVNINRNPYGSHSAIYEREDELDPSNWDRIYGDVQVARELRSDLEWAIAHADKWLILEISEILAKVMARIKPSDFGSALAFTKTELDRLSIGKRCRSRQYKTGSVYLVEPGRRRGRRRGCRAEA